MSRAFGFVSLIVVVGIVMYLFLGQTQSVTPEGTVPSTTIDLTGVRNDLMAIANAERRYFALNASYASLDELAANGDIEIPTRSHYSYSAETSDTGFRIIATYSGTDPKAPPVISVDETMTLSNE
jgi:hypothetical protein